MAESQKVHGVSYNDYPVWYDEWRKSLQQVFVELSNEARLDCRCDAVLPVVTSIMSPDMNATSPVGITWNWSPGFSVIYQPYLLVWIDAVTGKNVASSALSWANWWGGLKGDWRSDVAAIMSLKTTQWDQVVEAFKPSLESPGMLESLFKLGLKPSCAYAFKPMFHAGKLDILTREYLPPPELTKLSDPQRCGLPP